MQKTYAYLALGDSYTIGEAVVLKESFPYQAVQLLRKEGYEITAPEILARTGWTTEELLLGMADYRFSAKYDLVTLLIGVNNQYRQLPIMLYKEQFETLLKKSIELAGGKTEHVFIVSIPDYSVTPYAREKDTELIAKEIDEYNKLNKALSIQYKVSYLDITGGTREAAYKAGMLAEDGLHPSANEYARWAKKLAEAAAIWLKK